MNIETPKFTNKRTQKAISKEESKAAKFEAEKLPQVPKFNQSQNEEKDEYCMVELKNNG